MKKIVKERWYDKIPKLKKGESFCMSCVQVLQNGKLKRHCKSKKHKNNVIKKHAWLKIVKKKYRLENFEKKQE